jgi:hypothetical protein
VRRLKSSTGYAVMSNHLHIVVHMAPNTAREWTAAEVARRWVKLYPTGKEASDLEKIESILDEPARVEIYRGRLANLSWLMKSALR